MAASAIPTSSIFPTRLRRRSKNRPQSSSANEDGSGVGTGIVVAERSIVSFESPAPVALITNSSVTLYSPGWVGACAVSSSTPIVENVWVASGVPRYNEFVGEKYVFVVKVQPFGKVFEVKLEKNENAPRGLIKSRSVTKMCRMPAVADEVSIVSLNSRSGGVRVDCPWAETWTLLKVPNGMVMVAAPALKATVVGAAAPWARPIKTLSARTGYDHSAMVATSKAVIRAIRFITNTSVRRMINHPRGLSTANGFFTSVGANSPHQARGPTVGHADSC